MKRQKQMPIRILLPAFFIFFIVVLYSAPTFAVTYHVAPPPAGSDSNPGSAEHPFATLQKAADTVHPGDTVLVGDGHYTGFRLTESGTESARIIFIAAGNAAIIDTQAPDGYGIHLRNVSYITIEGFTILNVDEMGIAHRGAPVTEPVHGLIIRGNKVVGTKSVGMYFSEVADSLIENNEVDNCGQDGTHCIYMANAGTDGDIIRGNRIHGCRKAGIHFNGDLSVGGDGIIRDLVVEKNIIYDNNHNALNMDGVQDSIVRNNIIYNNSLNGIRAYRIDAAQGPKNLIIVNNTIHIPSHGGWAVRITAEGGGNTVFNNILINDASWGGSIAIDVDSYGFSSANNIVVNRFTVDRGNSIIDLLGWQAEGYGENSLIAPLSSLFQDIANNNYQLSTNSPAIDAGRATFANAIAPVTDITNKPRPQGSAIDIGAYENGGSPPQAPKRLLIR